MFLKINGNNINFTKDYTLLQICDSIGIRVPRFCYNDQMSIAGNCRMCLVELKGAPKPLVSCTSRGLPNMEVYTESPLVKKAREGVMEFLLSNHPLDCPICDQGGECDLQDQSEKFGSDSSRSFLFFRRPVQDKDMGLFIKTIMVRCIHCTRCVRFLKDKALSNDLGTIGRGENTEISFYFNKFLDKSLLSGNIVDICPVGALTNKSYSFKARPWEIDEIKYLGIADTLGLVKKIAIKRGLNAILRVTPSFSSEIGTKIISDFSRHCIDGLFLDTIEQISFKGKKLKLKPLLSENFKTIGQISKSILNLDKLFIKKHNVLVGPYTSFTDIFNLLFINNESGRLLWLNTSFLRKKINNIYSFLFSVNKVSLLSVKKSSSGFFFAKKRYIHKDMLNHYIIFGVDFLSEFPVLSSKIVKSFSTYARFNEPFLLGLFPYKQKNHLFRFKKGLSLCSLVDIVEGRSILCKSIAKNLNMFLFFNMLLKIRFDGNFIHHLFNLNSHIKNTNGVLSSTLSEVSCLDLSLKKNQFSIKNSYKNYSVFNTKALSNLLNTVFLTIGELSDKITSLQIKQPILIWMSLASFDSRNTILKENFDFNNILGNLKLPKFFIFEESFDFISTLNTYKKNFWAPLVSSNEKLNVRELYKQNTHQKTGLRHFIPSLNDTKDYSSSSTNFPVFVTKSTIFLTELKSKSKENFFKEDAFLKKSPNLIKLISFFKKSHNSFLN